MLRKLIKLIKFVKGYDVVFPFKNGYAQVQKNGKFGNINRFGKQICKIKYDYCSPVYDDLIHACIDDKWGLVSRKGKELSELKYDHIGAFRKNGFCVVHMNDIEGIIHISNPNEFIPFKLVCRDIGNGNDLYYARYKDRYILSSGGNMGTLEEFEKVASYSKDDNYIKIVNKFKESVKYERV